MATDTISERGATAARPAATAARPAATAARPAATAARPAATVYRDTADPAATAADTVRLAVTVALITGIAGVLCTIGADSRWLAALGGNIAARGQVPHGVPFAAAPTGHWANTLVLAELIFHVLIAAFGDRGLVLAQMLAVAAALAVLARDARAGGAQAGSTSAVLLLAALGALTSLAVVRVQLFSLVAFPLLVALLRAEARQPSRRIWLAPALLAVWANLHGAVLAGLVVLLVYLLSSRARRDQLTALAVGLAALAAVCLTPAGIASIDYYVGLVTNVAAERGVGQWAPLGSSPFDPVMVAVAAVLLLRLYRRRPALWEAIVLAILAAMTVKAGRDGVWLLLFLVPLAAAAPRLLPTMRRGTADRLTAAAAALAAVLLVVALVQRPHAPGASPAILDRALSLAHGTPILADATAAEQVALAGGTIWAGNPIDAFTRATQAAYLDWLAGSPDGRTVLTNTRIKVVLANRGSAAAALTAADHAFVTADADATAIVFVRRVTSRT